MAPGTFITSIGNEPIIREMLGLNDGTAGTTSTHKREAKYEDKVSGPLMVRRVKKVRHTKPKKRRR